jgi:hypothetical protein
MTVDDPRGRGVNVFDVATILVASAALFGYVNHRLLHLPPTTGTLLVALASSLAIVVAEQLVPGLALVRRLNAFSVKRFRPDPDARPPVPFAIRGSAARRSRRTYSASGC